jgi:hypothetical protein
VRHWIGFAPLIVLVALGVLFAGYALKHDPRVQPHALVGKPVPALSLPDLDTGEMTPCVTSRRARAWSISTPRGARLAGSRRPS